jgi:hypothetical protein
MLRNAPPRPSQRRIARTRLDVHRLLDGYLDPSEGDAVLLHPQLSVASQHQRRGSSWLRREPPLEVGNELVRRRGYSCQARAMIVID